MDRYLGLISGTSADGIDAAIAGFDDEAAPVLVDARTFPYPVPLRARIEAAIAGQPLAPRDLVELDAAIGAQFGAAAAELLAGNDTAQVRAIGSHGQTIAHHPGGAHAGTLQLGDPNRIASLTGLPVVADFRGADVAAGGQGAPLAPLFHARLGAQAVVNLGGIANLTVVDGAGVRGFDTGPGNTLLDNWAARHGKGQYDADGAFARGGECDARLLETLMDDPYFAQAPPKSTGRERFNMAWLESRLGSAGRAPADVQATLAELTAATVAGAVAAHAPGVRCVHLCGGGVHNADLVARLGARLAPIRVDTTGALGMDPDFVEAALFAWLARERMLMRSPAGLQGVTGAGAPAVLGAIWLPPE